MTAVAFGCALAAIALALGAREFRRPSHDRMLDWLVATLPVAAYAQHATWSFYAVRVRRRRFAGTGTARDVGVAARARRCAAGRRPAPATARAARSGSWAASPASRWSCALPTTLATETWLILCGLAALVAGVALDRYLRQPRNGLTSVGTDRSRRAARPAADRRRRAARAAHGPGFLFRRLDIHAGRGTIWRRWRQRQLLSRKGVSLMRGASLVGPLHDRHRRAGSNHAFRIRPKPVPARLTVQHREHHDHDRADDRNEIDPEPTTRSDSCRAAAAPSPRCWGPARPAGTRRRAGRSPPAR